MGRSNIAVDDQIAAELSRVATKKGKTAYALANDYLNAALRIQEEGGKADEIYGAWKMNRIGKDVGALQWVGRNLMEGFIREYAPLDPEKFSHMWQEAGYNFGVYFQICFPTIDDVVSLVSQLKQSFTIGRVDFVEAPNHIPDDGTDYSLNIVSSYSVEFLTYLSFFWKGMLSAYGLEMVETEKNIAAGAVRIRFRSRGKLLKAEPQVIA